MVMTANFLAEWRREGRDVYPVADLLWPGGTAYYSSSPCLFYDPRVLDGGWGDVGPAVAIRPPGALQVLSTTLKLDDPTRSITQILKGSADPRRSRMLLRVASPRLTNQADWYTFFDGIVQDWSYEGTSVTIKGGTDDRPLLGYIPKVPVLKGAFSGAPAASLGTYLPIIYGIHDSSSLSGSGMVPTVCISFDGTLGYRYCPTIGRAHAVPRVYLNNVSKTIVADPPGAGQVSITYPVYGGLQITSINFGTAPAATDVVTCDIEGMTVDGTTSTGVILNPVDQLKHLLVNFVWGDWRSGPWKADSSAPIDTTTFAVASTYASQFGYEGSRKYGGTTQQIQAIQAIQDWLSSHQMMRLFWLRPGKLGCCAFDHRFPGYLSSPWIKEEQDQALGSSLVQAVDASQLVQRVNVSYLWGEVDQKYWQSLTVQDIRVPEAASQGMSWSWSSSRFV